MKRFLQNFLRSKPETDTLTYEMVCNGRHVFTFGVWGRTSTTAFQRIMNSSREVCIWGEPGGFLIDNLMDAYVHLGARMSDASYAERVKVLPLAFRLNQQNSDSAMALNDWSAGRELLEQAVVSLLQPAIPVQRLGFKEIRVRSLRTLDGLRQMFPNCQFVYLFRDPATQWPSVQTMVQWQESESIELFADQVEAMARLYMQREGIFIEDRDLRCVNKLDRLTQYLGLTNYDKRLVDDGVTAAKDKPPVSQEELSILQERLAPLYSEMKSRAAAFFE